MHNQVFQPAEPNVNILTASLNLIHDPAFVEFEAAQDAPSIFNAVGRTHTETWHSALLGWLLNPSSSHMLGTFPLKRFLLLARSRDERADGLRFLDLGELAVRGDFQAAVARPNENEPKEVSVPTHGIRFDVLVSNIAYSSESVSGQDEWSEVQILVEMKVDSKINPGQCADYIRYVEERRQERVAMLPISVAPQTELARFPGIFVGGSWIAIDFRSLASQVFDPCLEHPGISQFGSMLITEYLKTLRYQSRGGEPLAITKRDQELVNKLIEEHRPALDAIYAILNQTTGEYEPVSSDSAREPITISISGTSLTANSVRGLYQKVLEYLDGRGALSNLQLPLNSSDKRYIINDEPKHPRGNDFIAPVQFKGYYMEANKSRSDVLKDIKRLAQACGLSPAEVTRVAHAAQVAPPKPDNNR